MNSAGPESNARLLSPVRSWRDVRATLQPGTAPEAVARSVLRASGVESAPVDVRGIAQQLGLVIEPMYLSRWAGGAGIVDGIPRIWLRDEDPPERQRFTLAHELGHILLHHVAVPFRDDTFTGSPKENEANRFAFELLMPLHLLRGAAFRQTDTAQMAQVFKVPEGMMRQRLEKTEERPRAGARRR